MEDRATAAEVAGPDEWDGAQLRAALGASAAWLERHADAINALNVFPVPDGDTGLNMSLTLRSAVDGAMGASGTRLGDVAAAAARGALMGARGNSGVILAQILRAMARTLEGREIAGARVFAEALQAGADAAYAAVSNPVEGTILTVARATSRAACATAAQRSDIPRMLEAAHAAAREAVAQTPDLLPILKQSGVVDAGGEGYRVFLEGLLKFARGEAPPDDVIPIDAQADLSHLHPDPDDTYGYCTEVLFQGADIDPQAVQERLGLLGTSVLVVGDRQLLRVHVHTLQPGAVLSLATELGEIVKVKVDNMQLQHQEFAAVSSQPRRSSEPTSFSTQHPAPSTRPRTGLVAVALGEGLQRIFASLGAELVSGGQTMNPSVEELLTAIRRSPAEDVIVLPNNPNIVATAQQAASLVADGNVAVVPTYSLPQGISAALALNPEASLRQNAATLTEIAARCHCIELTRAVRAARLGDLEIRVGATMAIVDGRPAASGANYHELIATAVDQLPAGRYEIATVYVGADGTPAEADQLAAALSSRLGIPTEVQAGGQPHYAYIISVE